MLRHGVDRRRWHLPLLLGAVLTVAVGLGVILSAEDARLELAAADPAAGAVIEAAPTTVSLTFTHDLDPAETHVAVIGPDGSRVSMGEPHTVGATVVQRVRIESAGTVVVGFHTAARDGGPESSGQHRFVVGATSGGTESEGTLPPPPAAADDDFAGHSHGALGLPAALTLTVLVTGAVVVLGAAFRRRT